MVLSQSRCEVILTSVKFVEKFVQSGTKVVVICQFGMKKTKIALLGASSKTGVEFIELSKNHPDVEVYAFVRNPEKLKNELKTLPSNLSIVRFNVSGTNEWEAAIEECAVWVSIVGISGLMAARQPGDLYKKTASLLTALSDKYHPERILVVTSGGVVEAEGEPWILKKVLKPYFLNPMYADMRQMEHIIAESDMNYTIVRPPYLTNGKMKKDYRIVVDGWFKDDKVLSRKDLAHFLFTNAITLEERYNRRIVGLSY
jgi:putative NADH-flavin reductase